MDHNEGDQNMVLPTGCGDSLAVSLQQSRATGKRFWVPAPFKPTEAPVTGA